MADMFSEFGIEINLGVSGFDNIMSAFSRLASEGGKIGKTTDQISDAMRRLASAMADAINVDGAKKFAEAMRTADSSIRARLLQEIANNAEKLRTIQKALAKSLNDLVNPPGNGGESNVDRLIESGKRLLALWGKIKVAIKPAKKIYDFTNALATLNMQLRMLHYSSGMAVASLKAFGAVAELYGGSAQSIASYTERHKVQEARAQRGLGLGHFQETEWQFGFRYLPGEDAMARRRRAIEHAATLDEESRIAFAKMEDPSGYRDILAWAKRGVKDFDEFQAYVHRVTSMQTSDGRTIYDAATEESEKYKESVAKLKVQLDAAKQEFLLGVLPTIRRLVDTISNFVDGFNRLSPATKRAVGQFIAAIGLATSAILLYATLKNYFGGILKALRGVEAASAAGSIGGGIGSAGGKLIGGKASILLGVVDAVGGLTQRQIQIHSLSVVQQVLTSWYNQWRYAYMISGGAISGQLGIKAMMEDGVDEATASFIAKAAHHKSLFQKQQSIDNENLYNKLGEIISMSQIGENALITRSTSYISGNVNTNNDNRTVTVNQSFISTGDISRDASIAGNSMRNSVKAVLLDI